MCTWKHVWISIWFLVEQKILYQSWKLLLYLQSFDLPVIRTSRHVLILMACDWTRPLGGWMINEMWAVSVLESNAQKWMSKSGECFSCFDGVFACRCQFSTFEQCQEWLKRLNGGIRPPSHLEELFSFAFHAWCMEVYAGEKEQHGQLCRPGTSSTKHKELNRLKNELRINLVL